MLGKRMKHAHRYQEIISAFLRNGFGYIVKELGLTEMLSIPRKIAGLNHNVSSRTLGQRIRTFLEDLGPTFIKLGQIASTRRDIIPEHIIVELEKLQDSAPPFPFEQVRSIIENELGNQLDQLFAEFNEIPLATASIGQVHWARLHSGEEIAIKVQRPNIRPIIETDMEILEDLARLMESRLSWAKRYHIYEMMEEFSKALQAELDYYVEGSNSEKIANQFVNQSKIRIPDIYWDFSTKKVLTMEYIKGTKISQLQEMDHLGYDRKVIAERVTNSMLHQILIEGFFHGDPHPGNMMVLPDEVVVFMDFGMVGRLTSDMKYQLASLVISLKRGDTLGIIKAISKMGILSDQINMAVLRADVDELKEKYYHLPLSQISLGEAVNDLFTISFHHQIQIPADMTMLGKALLTVERVVADLDPDFNMMHAAEPFGQRLLLDRYHPKKIVKNTWSKFIEYTEIVTELPKNIKEFSDTLKKGKFRLEITMPDIHLFLEKLDRISNRLSFSIVLLAFSIIMVGLIVGSSISGQATLLWRLPAIEIGFGIALVMLIWLLYLIFKSGKF
ncbi:ABC1 kinase family protein [Peribacillus loiseleuriae]|uniref:ABC transporter n=1 Tax=Peribacillus loiseleuriae TaxID=1679170 RepID=A0A0K9GR14_9BACI|nr:AarF/UbiB family protein [Peribacillus loiseleuriae]KMY49139.1 ABC transporter [Peribacillus loiseleuriae]